MARRQTEDHPINSNIISSEIHDQIYRLNNSDIANPTLNQIVIHTEISSPVQEEYQPVIENPNQTTLFEAERRVETNTVQIQTDTKPVKAREVQTEEAWPKKDQNQVRQLSPFETYDFLFIRDLVNNLNFDNEVLHQNGEDLKAGFMFLLNKFKILQFEYEKEKRNKAMIDVYKDRVAEVTAERDQAIEKCNKLATKVELMNDIIQVSI